MSTYVSGTATVQCNYPGCRHTVTVEFDNLPPDEIEEAILGGTGWILGRYCPDCAPAVIAEREADDLPIC